VCQSCVKIHSRENLAKFPSLVGSAIDFVQRFRTSLLAALAPSYTNPLFIDHIANSNRFETPALLKMLDR